MNTTTWMGGKPGPLFPRCVFVAQLDQRPQSTTTGLGLPNQYHFVPGRRCLRYSNNEAQTISFHFFRKPGRFSSHSLYRLQHIPSDCGISRTGSLSVRLRILSKTPRGFFFLVKIVDFHVLSIDHGLL